MELKADEVLETFIRERRGHLRQRNPGFTEAGALPVVSIIVWYFLFN
jgi:hypothetical protein